MMRLRALSRKAKRHDGKSPSTFCFRVIHNWHYDRSARAGCRTVHALNPNQRDTTARASRPCSASKSARRFLQYTSDRGPSRLCVCCSDLAPHRRPQFHRRSSLRCWRHWQQWHTDQPEPNAGGLESSVNRGESSRRPAPSTSVRLRTTAGLAVSTVPISTEVALAVLAAQTAASLDAMDHAKVSLATWGGRAISRQLDQSSSYTTVLSRPTSQ